MNWANENIFLKKAPMDTHEPPLFLKNNLSLTASTFVMLLFSRQTHICYVNKESNEGKRHETRVFLTSCFNKQKGFPVFSFVRSYL